MASLDPVLLNHSSSTSDIQHSNPSGPSAFGDTSNLSAGLSAGGTGTLLASPWPPIDGNDIWLNCGPGERYLLIEDVETGDVLMPLFYLKNIFKANYSRKIANLNNRLVEKPQRLDFGVNDGAKHLYWLWAFESPQNIKAIIRQKLTDVNASGHLRLVLLPVIYNAMQSKEELRKTALFAALRRAMRQSTYWPLLQPKHAALGSSSSGDPPQPGASVRHNPDDQPGDEVESMDQEGALFKGPKSYAMTAAKYMSPYRDTAAKRVKREDGQQQLPLPPEARPRLAPGATLSGIQEELGRYKKQCVENGTKILRLEKELESIKALALQCMRELSEHRGGPHLHKKSASAGSLGGLVYPEPYRQQTPPNLIPTPGRTPHNFPPAGPASIGHMPHLQNLTSMPPEHMAKRPGYGEAMPATQFVDAINTDQHHPVLPGYSFRHQPGPLNLYDAMTPLPNMDPAALFFGPSAIPNFQNVPPQLDIEHP